MLNALQQSVCRTLAFFDLFGQPLTAEELFAYSFLPPMVSYAEFKAALPMAPADKICQSNGYYFLPGKEQLVEERAQRTVFSDQKLRRARLAARLIRQVPFVQAIFACNSVAFGAASQKSDIDFFIVASPGRVWIVRFFTNFILKLFGRRVGRGHSADKICLSFYADVKHLDLSGLRIAPDDVYLAYWLQTLLPLFDRDNVLEKIYRANSWVQKYLPNREFEKENVPKRKRAWQRFWEAMWAGAYGDLIEREAERLQRMKFSPALRQAVARNDNSAVITAGFLKFHDNDARPAIRDAWKKLCARL